MACKRSGVRFPVAPPNTQIKHLMCKEYIAPSAILAATTPGHGL